MKIKVGLIGAGLISDFHLNAYMNNQDVELISIADVHEERRSALARKYSIENHTADYEKLVNNKNIDLVDICTPHYLHHKMTIEAFDAGKDVILEKPIAMNLAEASEMIEKAEKTRNRFFVALNHRFVPEHFKIKKLLSENVIENPFFCLATCIGNEYLRMNDPDHWKGSWVQAGGGALADTGTHFIDLMHYFFGQPTAISTTLKKLVIEPDNKADDCSLVTFEFHDKMMMQVIILYVASSEPWTETYDIYGRNASLHLTSMHKKNIFENILSITKDKKREIINTDDFFDASLPYSSWGSDSWTNAINHFIDCLKNDKEPIVTPEDARKALQTILTTYESSRKGMRITLPAE